MSLKPLPQVPFVGRLATHNSVTETDGKRDYQDTKASPKQFCGGFEGSYKSTVTLARRLARLRLHLTNP
jgi:hypothetical protein